MTGGVALQVAMLVLGIATFLGLVLWLLRPGARQAARRAAEIPFRGEAPRDRDAHGERDAA